MVIPKQKFDNENVEDLPVQLIELCEKTGCEITQSNGQRIYAFPETRPIAPPKGCEIFIGRLPKNLYENHIIPLFERVGRLYKFRLMLDFSGKTRGYAFATYFRVEDANKAVEKLNGYEIRPRSFIGVYKSVDNCRLFIGNLPVEKTKEDLLEMLRSYCDGVVDVIMYPSYVNPTFNRGFAFVEFDNHRLAAMARRQFSPHNLNAWGQRLFVDWAEPIPEVDAWEMAMVKILYLKNLPPNLSSQGISVFVQAIAGNRVVKVFKMHNFCFVHFIDRKSAEEAMNLLRGMSIGNYAVEVEWARPRTYSRRYRQETVPQNFCTSFPLKIRKQVKQRIAYFKRNNGTRTVSDSSSYFNSSFGSHNDDFIGEHGDNQQLDFAGAVSPPAMFPSDHNEIMNQPSTSGCQLFSGGREYSGWPEFNL